MGSDHTVHLLLLFFFFKPSLKCPKWRPPCLRELPTCLLKNTRTINGTQALWNSGPNTSPFSAVCRVTAFSSRLKAGLDRKPLQTNPSNKPTVLVQTCGIASRQTGSDKPLTETWMLKCYHWQRYEASKYWINRRRRPPISKSLETTLYGRLILLFDLGSCFLGSSPFSPQSSLARPSNARMSLSVKESEAFYIRSVPGDGFPIFISLCEPLPKMSNPLQACL